MKDALAALTATERRAYDGTLNAAQETRLPVGIVAELAERARKSSASQAKMLAHCVYQHFGKQRLRIEALEPPMLDQLVLGSVMHQALHTLGLGGFDATAIGAAVDQAWNAVVPRAIAATPAASCS